MSKDNRRAPRKNVHLAAKLVREDSPAIVSGHLVNMSATGALLNSNIQTDASALQRDTVWDCTVPTDGFTVKCRVVHQSGSKIGLQFTSTPKLKR